MTTELPQRFKNRDVASRLKELEKIVSDRMSYVVEVAAALKEINESKLYRLDYKTFDDYTRAVFGFGKSHAYRLISSHKITDKDSSSSSTQVDYVRQDREEIKEGQSTAGSQQEEEQKTEQSQAGSTEQSDEPAPPEEERKPIFDEEGHEVPKEIEKAFLQVAGFKELDSLAQKLQAGIDAISRTHAGLQLARQLQSTGTEEKRVNKSEHLNALKRDLKFTRPHSVCPYCAGKSYEEVKDCKGCAGAGWVTKITYQSAPDELKARMACSI